MWIMFFYCLSVFVKKNLSKMDYGVNFLSFPHSSKKPILKKLSSCRRGEGERKRGAIIPDIRNVSRVGRPIMSHFQPFISLIQCTPAPLSHSSTFFRYWLAISSFGNCAELIDRDDILLLLEEVKVVLNWWNLIPLATP
jgi:hypothetical protein